MQVCEASKSNKSSTKHAAAALQRDLMSSTTSTNNMDSVLKTCQQILEIDRRGASAVQRDCDTIVIWDYDMLCSEQMLQLTQMYPRLHVTTHSSKASNSGYCIILTLRCAYPWYARSETYHALLLFLACFAMLCPGLQSNISRDLFEWYAN